MLPKPLSGIHVIMGAAIEYHLHMTASGTGCPNCSENKHLGFSNALTPNLQSDLLSDTCRYTGLKHTRAWLRLFINLKIPTVYPIIIEGFIKTA